MVKSLIVMKKAFKSTKHQRKPAFHFLFPRYQQSRLRVKKESKKAVRPYVLISQSYDQGTFDRQPTENSLLEDLKTCRKEMLVNTPEEI
jgi:hypothetical protein